MDDLDKYIESIVSKEISEPESFEKAIREALYSEKFYKRMRKRKLIKTISTACATVVLTTGITFGGYIVYEKVWKEPKQYTYEELKNKIADSEVSEEEKENLITEEVAKQNVLEMLDNLGYEGQQIEKIELNENREEGFQGIYFIIQTNNQENQVLNIRIDAKTGRMVALRDMNLLEQNITTREITKEDAVAISNEMYKKLGLNQEEYELSYCEKENILYKGNGKEVWNIRSYKKYNDLINPYEELMLNLIIDNEKIRISSITNMKNGKYEDNEQVITKEEAIEIATKKEKEFTSNEISEIKSELGIRKMNGFLFELENYGDILYNAHQEEDTYQINMSENIVRNVWIIQIKHNATSTENMIEYLKGKDKEYYVDITTGEIIGGNTINNE